jgi:hypothetical protein
MKKLTVLLKDDDINEIGFILNYIAASIKKGFIGNSIFPVKWEAIEETQEEHHTVFILFETDAHKTKQSRVFLGAFASEKIAEETAQKNNCYRHDCNAEIVPTQINEFKEI